MQAELTHLSLYHPTSVLPHGAQILEWVRNPFRLILYTPAGDKHKDAN